MRRNHFLLAAIIVLASVSCSRVRSLDSYISKIGSLVAENPDSSVLTIPSGEYALGQTIVLENLSNLTIEGAADSTTIISGDKEVKGWTADPERPGVLVADLSGIEDLGEPSGFTNRVDFYCDGKRQHIARWPNEDYTKSGKAVGPTSSNYGCVEGMFEYCEDRITKWAEEPDVYLHGYWFMSWAEDSEHVRQIDTVKKVFTLDEPYHNYGYKDSLKFYGFNLLCELDTTSEYYIDRSARKIYWMPCEGFDKGTSRTSVSVFKDSVAVIIRNCSNVTLRNLTFRGLRNKGILIEGGENVKLENCTLSDIGDDAICINGGKDHQLSGCHLSELGCGGIWATGGNRRTLETSGFVFSDNIVENFSLFKYTYEPAVWFHGVGMQLTHNLFQHSTSSAMRVEGNDINVEYNQCFDLVTESDDQGGSDTFFDFSFRRINFRYNHWRDITGTKGTMAAAIRFDDLISGNFVTGNVFEHCGGGDFGAVQCNGGKDNTFADNVFYNCPAIASSNVWDDEAWKMNYFRPDHVAELEESDCFSEIYLNKYPELRDKPESNRSRNWLTDNLIVNYKELILHVWSGTNGFIVSGNTLIQQSDKPLSYYLDPEVLAYYGLEPIPFDEIGPRR